MPQLESIRTFVMGSIKSISDGKNLDSKCFEDVNISEKDYEEYLEREGIKPKIVVINTEKERLKINRFLRAENTDLNVVSKQYVDNDKKKTKVLDYNMLLFPSEKIYKIITTIDQELRKLYSSYHFLTLFKTVAYSELRENEDQFKTLLKDGAHYCYYAHFLRMPR